jgi:stage V sporulation protein AC
MRGVDKPEDGRTTEPETKYNSLDNLVAGMRMEKERAEPEGPQPEPKGMAERERQEREREKDQQAYQWFSKRHQPRIPVARNLVMAFLVGGLICAVGQLIWDVFKGLGMGVKDASTTATVIMIFLGAFLTGLGVYDRIGKVGGAGSVVPITGFANGIVASAMEYKREGYVYGVGARIFTIAGPVLVYGFLVSVFVGLIRVLLT